MASHPSSSGSVFGTAPEAAKASLKRVADQTARSQIEKLLASPDCSEERARKCIARAHWQNGRRPGFWQDIEVRLMLARLHRQATLAQARSYVAELYGAQRCPSQSALQRFWSVLDEGRE